VFAVVALVAWVAGSALGSIGAVTPASAQTAGLVMGKAHAGYAPSLTGNKPIVLLVVGSGARLLLLQHRGERDAAEAAERVGQEFAAVAGRFGVRVHRGLLMARTENR